MQWTPQAENAIIRVPFLYASGFAPGWKRLSTEFSPDSIDVHDDCHDSVDTPQDPGPRKE